MEALRFPYTEWQNPLGGAPYPTPILPVWLCDPDGRRRVQVQALVDTGATESFFPIDVMRALGIAHEDCRSMPGGSSGGTTRHLERAEPLIAELDHPETPGACYRFKLGANFTLAGAGAPHEAILGRRDFLGVFMLSIFERSRAFVLEPYPDMVGLELREGSAPEREQRPPNAGPDGA